MSLNPDVTANGLLKKHITARHGVTDVGRRRRWQKRFAVLHHFPAKSVLNLFFSHEGRLNTYVVLSCVLECLRSHWSYHPSACCGAAGIQKGDTVGMDDGWAGSSPTPLACLRIFPSGDSWSFSSEPPKIHVIQVCRWIPLGSHTVQNHEAAQ